MRIPYTPRLSALGDKVFVGPMGSEPIGEYEDEVVFADKNGAGRSPCVGTFRDEPEWA